MSKIRFFHIDAFTSQPFRGNPAAVCFLHSWPEKEWLQHLASELSLPETAFVAKHDDGRYHIRWFTPEMEMDLCGHATLAAAHAILHEQKETSRRVVFDSAAGLLTVKREDGLLWLDFPARRGKPAPMPEVWKPAFATMPVAILLARDYLMIFDHEDQVAEWQPDRTLIDQFDMGKGGLIVSAPGITTDFVSRFFTPKASVFEDPVTGSAHCTLIPYWSDRLGKKQLTAKQLSQRQGDLRCVDHEDRVAIGGEAVTVAEGYITLD